MDTLKFKTTIKCSGCLEKVTPALDEAVGKDNWNVDILAPEKILTISAVAKADHTRVVKAIERAGFKAERLV